MVRIKPLSDKVRRFVAEFGDKWFMSPIPDKHGARLLYLPDKGVTLWVMEGVDASWTAE